MKYVLQRDNGDFYAGMGPQGPVFMSDIADAKKLDTDATANTVKTALSRLKGVETEKIATSEITPMPRHLAELAKSIAKLYTEALETRTTSTSPSTILKLAGAMQTLEAIADQTNVAEAHRPAFEQLAFPKGRLK